MSAYLRNRRVRIALALFALGSVPLAVVALLAPWAAPLLIALSGLWLVTFWPAVFCLAAGIVQVRGQISRGAPRARPITGSRDATTPPAAGRG